MRKHVIRMAAVAGLVTLLATTASAHGGEREVIARVGPTYIHWSAAQSYDRDYSRYDRYYRHAHKRDRQRHRHHRREIDAHELWHWYNDGRRDRYFRHDHALFHASLGHRRHHDRLAHAGRFRH